MTEPGHNPSAFGGPPRGGRLVAALVLVVVAFVGVAAGVALDRAVLLHHRDRPGRDGLRGDAGRGPAGMRGRLARELDLSDAQRQRLDTVMERQGVKFRAARQQIQPRMDSIFDETRRAVDSILTPTQRARLDSMRRTRAFGPPFPMPDRRRAGDEPAPGGAPPADPPPR